jgi:tetratricopeptide (TPR) repeat protein
LSRHRLLQAGKDLALAEALSAPAVQLQPLKARLRDLEAASSDVSALLAQATAPERTDEAALVLFNRVLQLHADNPAALEGRRALFERWLARAELLLADGKVRAAQELVDRVVTDDPGHLDLPPVQAKLGEAMARLQREQVRILERAQADERAGRIDRAAEGYLWLVDAGDDSSAVQDGLHRLAAGVALRAQREAADFQFRRAHASLEKARQWSPEAPEIAVAERRVEQSRQAQQRLLRKPARGDREKLPQLLAEAEQAMARGDYITPPGTSAWDKLRVAGSIAPDSPKVLNVQRDFVQRSRACFERAMTDNQLKRAQNCLEANLSLDSASPAAADARNRLANRWLAYAEERIAAGDYPEAGAALSNARQWQPAHPKLEATSARLNRARGESR